MEKRNCKNCTENFQAKRKWQIFCSNYCRAQFHKSFQYCFYCGDFLLKSCKDVDLQVKICKECKDFLGKNSIPSIEERFAYLSENYIRKYKLESGIKEWTAGEQLELGENLRQEIKGMLYKRRIAEEKVLYLQCKKKDF